LDIGWVCGCRRIAGAAGDRAGMLRSIAVKGNPDLLRSKDAGVREFSQP
jgi:hypothetical protein